MDLKETKESEIQCIQKRTDGWREKNSKEEKIEIDQREIKNKAVKETGLEAGSGNNDAAAFLIVGHFVATLV